MKIRLYKANYNYVLQINNDLWEVSDNADMPNGVCQYMGDDYDFDFNDNYKIMDYMSIGIVRKIIQIIGSKYDEK